MLHSMGFGQSRTASSPPRRRRNSAAAADTQTDAIQLRSRREPVGRQFVAKVCQTIMVVCFMLLAFSTNESLACIGGAGGGCCMTSGCPNPCAGFGKK